MNLEVDVERLQLARKAVRADLIAERAADGHWPGQLGSSPLATAAAISALVLAHRHDSDDALRGNNTEDRQLIEQLVQGDLCELLLESVHWLARHQNEDGGWGDCDGAQSNIAATLMVQAAFRLTGIPAKYADLMVRADDYVEAQGGIAALRKQVRDKMLLAAILANCALADMIPWRQVPTLPFELAGLPKRWQEHMPLPVARFAMPVFIAVGRARFQHDPPRNPITRWLRNWKRAASLRVLERLQAADDSFLASPAFSAFVVMNVASIGCQDHAIVIRGVEFLLSSVRADASWALTTNLAVTNTTLVLASLATDRTFSGHAREEWRDDHALADPDSAPNAKCLEWLLACQRTGSNPVTGAAYGGWAWSGTPGALPNTIDTAGALLAFARWPRPPELATTTARIEHAARLGIIWLLDLQNDDGGWSTFCRSDARHFDPSNIDATTLAARALFAWQGRSSWATSGQIRTAINNSVRFVESQQEADGGFESLWFGNEHNDDNRNLVWGTAQVLLMCADLERLDSEVAKKAARWLTAAQHSEGGWGPPRAPVDYSDTEKDGSRDWRANEDMAKFCSIEETALAITALFPLTGADCNSSQAVSRGLNWLINAVEQDRHRHPTAIGYHLSKLWYHERLYPLAFAAGALERAVHQLVPKRSAVERVS